MLHDLVRPIVPQPIFGFSLDTLVYEVHALLGPAHGQLAFFDLDLSGENLVPDLLSAVSSVRPESHHTLKDNHA